MPLGLFFREESKSPNGPRFGREASLFGASNGSRVQTLLRLGRIPGRKARRLAAILRAEGAPAWAIRLANRRPAREWNLEISRHPSVAADATASASRSTSRGAERVLTLGRLAGGPAESAISRWRRTLGYFWATQLVRYDEPSREIVYQAEVGGNEFDDWQLDRITSRLLKPIESEGSKWILIEAP